MNALKNPNVLWFSFITQHHAFEVLEDGTLDETSCCGGASIEFGADEPARDLADFTAHPACVPCLAVAELKVPRLA